MDASKQISTLSIGKWVMFRKTSQPEDIKIYGNGVVYPVTAILSGPARSAADELARSYQ